MSESQKIRYFFELVLTKTMMYNNRRCLLVQSLSTAQHEPHAPGRPRQFVASLPVGSRPSPAVSRTAPLGCCPDLRRVTPRQLPCFFLSRCTAVVRGYLEQRQLPAAVCKGILSKSTPYSTVHARTRARAPSSSLSSPVSLPPRGVTRGTAREEIEGVAFEILQRRSTDPSSTWSASSIVGRDKDGTSCSSYCVDNARMP